MPWTRPGRRGSSGGPGRVTHRQVLANSEFRAMYAAQFLSVLGDQVAKVALALLVYYRSGSPLLTALTYGVTLLPWLLGGPLLSSYADRLPRRQVMIFCDLGRAGLVVAMALLHLPLPMLFALLFAVTLLDAPFSAARAAMQADVLEGEAYVVGASLNRLTLLVGEVVGFVAGGALVTLVSTRGALLLDATTFLVSAALVAFGRRHRPAARQSANTRLLRDAAEGISTVLADRLLRPLLALSWWSAALVMVPEGLAVVYAARQGGGPVAAGLLTAALPLGVFVGGVAAVRFLDERQRAALMLPMAALSFAPLVLTLLEPPLSVALPLWALSGVGTAFQLAANRLFVVVTPQHLRGRAFGLAQTGLLTGQALAVAAAGALASQVSPATVVGGAGVLGLAGLVPLALRWPYRLVSLSASQDALASPPAASATLERAEATTEHDLDAVTATKAAGAAAPVPRPEAPAVAPTPAAALSNMRSPVASVWLLTAGLAVLAGLLFVGLPSAAPLPEHRQLPWWWLVPVFVFTHAYVVHFEFRRQSRIVLLDQLPLVLGLYLVPPAALVLARLLGALVVLVARRQQPLKLFFNLAAIATEVALSVTVFRLLFAGGGVGPESWPAAFAATGVYEAAATLAVAAAISLFERRWRLHETGEQLLFSAAVTVVMTSLSLVAVTSLYFDLRSGTVLAVCVAVSVMAFQGYRRLAVRHAALDRLYAFARELGPVAPQPADLAPALVELKDLLHADRLQLALVNEGPDCMLVVVDEGGAVLDSPTGSGALPEPAREVLTTGQPALSPRNRRGNKTSPSDHMAVAIRGDDRALGVLVAEHRASEVRGFDSGDLRLMEAAAGQLGTALEKGRLIEGLRHAVISDALTGLPNLEHLRNRCAAVLGAGEAAPVVLLFLDLDHFQDVNDTLGHEAGDGLLVEVGRRLREATPAGGLAARVGDDQFALLLPGHTDSEVARLAALGVKSRVDGPVRLGDLGADVRVTVGVARAPQHGGDVPTLFRRAEMAMRAAKGSSSGIVEWEPRLEWGGSRRLQLVTSLRRTLADNGMAIQFQPKLRLRTGEVVGLEALVRWRHGQLGAVGPEEFVPLAEAAGLVGPLTTHVLRLALGNCHAWQEAGMPVGVSVNLSARSLSDPVVVGQVAALLTASGIEPRQLTLEITESSVMENPTRSIDLLRQLRSLGVRLSIDDFGTGYSSLTYVKGLPVHELKVDRSFISNIATDATDQAIVRAVVELARNLRLTTVAEGVERPEQALVLESLGLDEVQGYFYARPMTPETTVRWLSSRRRATQP